MAGGIFGFFMGAAAAVIVMRIFKKQDVKFGSIRGGTGNMDARESGKQIEGAVRAMNQLSTILEKVSSTSDTMSKRDSPDKLNGACLVE